jgi:hypothetical protein
LQSTLSFLKNSVWTVTIVSFLFMIFHIGVYTNMKSVSFESIFTMTVLYAFQVIVTAVTIKKKDIIFAIVWHYVYDVTLFGFKGFPS